MKYQAQELNIDIDKVLESQITFYVNNGYLKTKRGNSFLKLIGKYESGFNPSVENYNPDWAKSLNSLIRNGFDPLNCFEDDEWKKTKTYAVNSELANQAFSNKTNEAKTSATLMKEVYTSNDFDHPYYQFMFLMASSYYGPKDGF
jgi:hypothetical protein